MACEDGSQLPAALNAVGDLAEVRGEAPGRGVGVCVECERTGRGSVRSSRAASSRDARRPDIYFVSDRSYLLSELMPGNGTVKNPGFADCKLECACASVCKQCQQQRLLSLRLPLGIGV